MRASVTVVAALCGGAIFAGCGGNQPRAIKVAGECASPGATTPTATTRDYVFVANVERYQAMYTAAQVRATHPAMGEVMVGGRMGMRSAIARAPKTGMTGRHTRAMGSASGMSGAAMGGRHPMSVGQRLRHLEVKVCSRRTGRVVPVQPTISVQDLSNPRAMARPAPAEAMEGVGEGRRDLHYGGNIAMVAGHRYSVTVRVGGQRAVLRMLLRAGKGPVAIR
jgi:hypothetical protein